jgi:hypothetical protein
LLLGGGAEYDLTSWRRSTVVCRGCGADVSASDADVVALSAPSNGAPVWANHAPTSSIDDRRRRV